MEAFLRSLAGEYEVRAPVALEDGTRVFGRVSEGTLALSGGPVLSKPTAVFFPQFERVFTYRDGVVVMERPSSLPLLVVGFTAADAESLAFVDEFFRTDYRDDLYLSRREHAVIAVVSGRCGKGGEFLKIAGGNCDLELIGDGEQYGVVPYSAAGKALAERIGGEATGAWLNAMREESRALPTEEREILERASQLLQEDRVPDEFWKEITDRCIACTACNLVCPTCTCFEVFDWTYRDRIERWRLWDSCQLDGFTREASGHNPMGEPHLRTRRRIHHKLAADRTRWNQISCFLCGRCDDVCPTGIGIKAVSREIVRRWG